jgi:DNA-binding response OmpR family regulator
MGQDHERGRAMKCVVAEDDPFWSSEICATLGTHGIETFAAHDGAQALKLLRQNPGAGLVLDIILPDQDGLEVLRDARAEQPDVRVIAISGGGRLGADFYLKLAGAFGANVTIQKPFTALRLIEGWKTATSGA